MEGIANISSEEELLGLRREGKISETEYRELLGAMRKGPSSGTDAAPPESDEAASKRRLGKIAFVLMLVGIVLPVMLVAIVLPVVCWLFSASEPDIDVYCFALFAVFQVAAFVFGVSSWPDVYGKATVTVVALMGVVTLKFVS